MSLRAEPSSTVRSCLRLRVPLVLWRRRGRVLEEVRLVRDLLGDELMIDGVRGEGGGVAGGGDTGIQVLSRI